MRNTGVAARGIITPMFTEGGNLVADVSEAVLTAAKQEGYGIDNGDVIGITESIVARTQGNYATIDHMAAAIQQKFGKANIGLVFPILSRNRFSVVLRAIAQASKKVIIQLSYPADEVGNAILSQRQLDEAGVNPFTDSFNEASFREVFGFDTKHPFTDVDYIDYYKSLAANIEIVFSNNPAHILEHTDHVLCCDVHTRRRTKNTIQNAAQAAGQNAAVCGLDDILTQPIDGSGYNPDYGLLGTNLATEDSVKLFPRDCDEVVHAVQRYIKDKTGKTVEVMVYGDGCFKDPVGGIWELADPVVAPGYTDGLKGTPSEIKLKYFADNDFKDLEGDALEKAMRQRVKDQQEDDADAAQGTTPRRYIDLLGSLCDLVSGSGDKGTPVVHIKNYFTNFASK